MAPNNGGKMKQQELQNIIDFAIEKEKEAVSFYYDLASKVKLKALAEEIRRLPGYWRRKAKTKYLLDKHLRAQHERERVYRAQAQERP